MDKSKDGLTSMKRPAGRTHPSAIAAPTQEEDYGYGLCLRLENFDLDALKLALPQPGKEYRITAVGKVTDVHESKSQNNKGDRSVTIQITDLAIR